MVVLQLPEVQEGSSEPHEPPASATHVNDKAYQHY